MLRVILGVFTILHGLVHLLYFGHGFRFYQLQEGLEWPDGAWVSAGTLGVDSTRAVAAIACVVAAAVFAVAGVALFARQAWWRPVTSVAAAASSVLFLLAWNGKMQALASQGLIAILINIALVVLALAVKTPDF